MSVMPFGSHLAGLTGAALRVQTDERLVLLAGEGHQAAFEELVRRHRAPLVAYACRVVRFDQAEDVAQEAFARLHTALAGGEAPVEVLPWLYVVARNRALNLIRDERAHDQLDENYDGVPQPPEIAIRHEELADLVAQIKDLPHNQREALVQREMEGRSHDHIGASLGVSATSARGLIFRARTALRSAAGFVIALPLLRALLETEPARASGIAATGSGGAAGLAGGSTAVLALKGAAVLAGVATLVGASGLVLEQDHELDASAAVASGASGHGKNAHPSQHDLAATGASAKHRNNKPGGRDNGPQRSADGSRKPGTPGSSNGDHTTVSEATASEHTDEPRAKEVGDDATEDWKNEETGDDGENEETGDDEESEEADDDVGAGDDGGDSDADGDEGEVEIDEEIDPDHLDSQSSPDDQED